ncbi:type IV secretion system DNA-binding domain-containing protein [Streptomyces sp. AN091965]|uniref:type IV secretion system DNA-binding domain-containing protein n=1 Tax=Streptomyces sp. AN091965 TaxID=2927803 RepID=UPI001F624A6C|nr:type IV secretion system DNA-binding domain-containing protein [Streptomyces sp. AN091965]MCI3928804.1 type IV secretion system DNA-binding domain-containing protein [Streptomyces sp. AN091965]
MLGTLIAARWWWRRWYRRRLADGARVIELLPPPSADPAGATALWSHLVGLLRPAWRRLLAGQPHLSWEYVLHRQEVRIQLWVPGVIPPGMVERAIEAAWPGALTRTRPANAPVRLTPSGEAAWGELRLARHEALPLRTDLPSDPLRALLGTPIGLGQDENAVVQVLARPVTGSRVQKARRAARRLGTGGPARPVSRLLDAVTPRLLPRSSTSSVDRQTALEMSAASRAIVAKQRGALYESRLRYAVVAPVADSGHTEVRHRVRDRLRGHAHAVASTYASYTEHNFFRRTRPHRALAHLSERRLDKGDLLCVPELAALAHLPWDATVPGLQRAGARAVPPPPGVAAPGPSAKPIGRTTAGGIRPVGLWIADARQHLHILGATGSGKSELMAHMVLADAEAGRGQVVIDPKGDLVTDVLMRLPERLGERVVLFDANSRHRPPVINPLEGEDAVRTVDNLVSLFSRVYASSWGPRTDDILRAGLLTLRTLSDAPALTDLPTLLAAPAFRQRAVRQIHDPVLRGFWSWYDDLSAAARAQVTAPLMNKLRGLLLRPFVREALAGGTSSVEMDQVLDTGGICLVRIARDHLGAETARLVGSVVVARTWQATTRRARVPQGRRPDASLYVDEAHHFLNLPYALEDMLSEARGYRLSMTLAHQYLRQLPKELEEGISTNARTKIFFNASPEDARHLARHTEPRLTEHDLSNLGAFHAAVRPVVHGAEAPAFTVVTAKLPPAVPGRARRIRAAAQRNARPTSARPTLRKQHPSGTDPRRNS